MDTFVCALHHFEPCAQSCWEVVVKDDKGDEHVQMTIKYRVPLVSLDKVSQTIESIESPTLTESAAMESIKQLAIDTENLLVAANERRRVVNSLKRKIDELDTAADRMMDQVVQCTGIIYELSHKPPSYIGTYPKSPARFPHCSTPPTSPTPPPPLSDEVTETEADESSSIPATQLDTREEEREVEEEEKEETTQSSPSYVFIPGVRRIGLRKRVKLN